ncbi:MAG TPA: hypothetical protein VGW78_05815 [Candidatus Babeliales bacterium]|nr:hypothetical protein [Candidatus Babeliales bacterium]
MQSSACIDNPQSFRNSFLHRMLTPSNNSVFSRKQWAITTGVFGVTLATFGIWKYCVCKKVNSRPIEEKKEVIEPVFNPVLDLANHYKIWMHTKAPIHRESDDVCNRKLINDGLNGSALVQAMEVKNLLHRMHIKNIISGMQNNALINSMIYRYPELTNEKAKNGTCYGWPIRIDNGQVIELSLNKYTPCPDLSGIQKEKYHVTVIKKYEPETVTLFNEVLQELKRKPFN